MHERLKALLKKYYIIGRIDEEASLMIVHLPLSSPELTSKLLMLKGVDLITDGNGLLAIALNDYLVDMEFAKSVVNTVSDKIWNEWKCNYIEENFEPVGTSKGD